MPSPMVTELIYADMSYCSLCDRYFPGDEARAEHVQFSDNHPKCDTCDKRFANRNSLRNHWVCSPRHNYCAVCERDFATAAGLRVHIEFAAVHRDDSDDEDDGDDGDYEEGWEDEMGREVYPEEHDGANMTASDDESYTESNEYWDEDDETDLEDERESYRGFALRQIAPNPTPQYIRPRASSGDSDTSAGLVSNVAVGSVSDDSDFGDEPAPLVPTAFPPPHVMSPMFQEIQRDPRELAPHKTYIPPSAILFNCPLCLEAPRETSATRCGHVFCTPCINMALDRRRKCPVCREATGPRQLRKIFLSAN